MSHPILAPLVLIAFFFNGTLFLWIYCRRLRSSPFYFYFGIWSLLMVPAFVFLDVATYNDAPAVGFGRLKRDVQQLRKNLDLRGHRMKEQDPKEFEQVSRQLQDLERELSDKPTRRAILPQLPWKAIAVVSLLASVLMPLLMYTGRLCARGARPKVE